VDAPAAYLILDEEDAAPEAPSADLVVPAQVARDAAAIVDAATMGDPVPGGSLTDPERAILDFERAWWKQGGAKEQAIRETFGMTPTRYYQALNGVLALPGAVQYDAVLVHRLLRVRAEATRGRRQLD
jgi:hypothetical protein